MKKHFPVSAFIIMMLLMASVFPAYAQHVEITGIIKNELNEPLSGANIFVKGRVIGTISNHIGDFYLEVKDVPPILLSFSMIGYKGQEIKISENKGK